MSWTLEVVAAPGENRERSRADQRTFVGVIDPRVEGAVLAADILGA